jgi:hypothetical protein
VLHALNLFYLLISDIRFRHVFFVDGISEQSIENGLVTRIGPIGRKYSRSSASEALEVLSNPDHEVTRDWAIVYDGVDNRQEGRECVPVAGCWTSERCVAQS